MPQASADGSCHVVQELAENQLARATVPLDSISSPRATAATQDNCIELSHNHGNVRIQDGTDIETGVSENEASPRSGNIAKSPRNAEKTASASPEGETNDDLRRVIIAFSLCCLSTIVSHVIRIPLYTTKVELQNSMNFTTLDLTHLDNFFSVSHALGQMTSPLLSSKSHSVLVVTLHHFIMGVTISLLFATNKFSHFTIVYTVAGFVSGPAWAVLFTHLSAWLPEKYSFPMITLWFTCTDFGYIIGGLICMYVHAHWGWRHSYVVSGVLNILVGLMLFCLHDDCKQPLENNRLIDPRSIIQKNIGNFATFIQKLRWGDPKVNTFIKNEGKTPPPVVDPRREFILSGISNIKPHANTDTTAATDADVQSAVWSTYAVGTYEKLLTGVRQYISVIRRMSYLGRILIASFMLMMVKHCFSSWISFYVCTVYNHSASRGSYVSFILRLGNCIGNIGSALLCKVYWKGRPLTACLYFFGLSAVVVFSFCMLDFSSVLVYSICCCLCGIVTSAAEAIMMAKGIKSLCDRSQLSQRESVSVYGFLLSTTTVGSVAQGFLVAYVVDSYGWTTLFAIFVVALLIATALLYKPSRAEQNQ